MIFGKRTYNLQYVTGAVDRGYQDKRFIYWGYKNQQFIQDTKIDRYQDQRFVQDTKINGNQDQRKSRSTDTKINGLSIQDIKINDLSKISNVGKVIPKFVRETEKLNWNKKKLNFQWIESFSNIT